MWFRNVHCDVCLLKEYMTFNYNSQDNSMLRASAFFQYRAIKSVAGKHMIGALLEHTCHRCYLQWSKTEVCMLITQPYGCVKWPHLHVGVPRMCIKCAHSSTHAHTHTHTHTKQLFLHNVFVTTERIEHCFPVSYSLAPNLKAQFKSHWPCTR